ncbi:MAG: hypothetical protein MAG551_01012 [Candidatus Scalindua arabica]|uniref:TIR domain-containing protein n=1 Tax=Candidatus Scalindua arabica TaxID=1127984 RepID=A0A941W1M7_9BACT|nr:hypothetical protein [Candidatus Scalindua arabica]
MGKSRDYTIFLSCAAEDTDTTKRLYEGMKERELNVTFDRVDINPKKWEAQVKKAISRSQILVICISKKALVYPSGGNKGFLDTKLNDLYNIVY